MQYYKEADETIRLTDNIQSKLMSSLHDIPEGMRKALFHLSLCTDKGLRPLVVIDENDDRYIVLGNGENSDLAMTVYRYYPHSNAEIPLCLQLEIIKYICGEIPESLWVEVDGIPLRLTPDTFDDF